MDETTVHPIMSEWANVQKPDSGNNSIYVMLHYRNRIIEWKTLRVLVNLGP